MLNLPVNMSLSLPDVVAVNKDGSFRVREAAFRIENFSQTWKLTGNCHWTDVESKVRENVVEICGVMPVGDKLADVTERITPLSEMAFDVDFAAAFRQPTVANSVHAVIEIPAEERTIQVDGRNVHLPADYSEMRVFGTSQARQLVVHVDGGYVVRVTGNPLSLFTQDDRKYGVDKFMIRMFATPMNGEMMESKLHLSFEISREEIPRPVARAAPAIPEVVRMMTNGSFRIRETSFRFEAFSASWKGTSNTMWTDIRKQKFGCDGLDLTAVMNIDEKIVDVREVITPVNHSQFQVDFEADFREQTLVRSIHGVFVLPIGKRDVRVDGKVIEVPEEYSDERASTSMIARSLSFGVDDGYVVVVTGSFQLVIQDNRKFKSDTFAYRICATPNHGDMKHTELHFVVDVLEPGSALPTSSVIQDNGWLTASMPNSSAELHKSVKLLKNGSFCVGEAAIQIQNFSSSWKLTQSNKWTDLKLHQFGMNGVELTAVMPVAEKLADVRQCLTPLSESQFRLDFCSTFREATVVNSLHAAITLPAEERTIMVNGAHIQLPRHYRDMVVLPFTACNDIRFAIEGAYELVVSGAPLQIMIQDDRKFGVDQFSLRLYATPKNGEMTQSELHLLFGVCAPDITNVSLEKLPNVSFADVVELEEHTGEKDLDLGNVCVGGMEFEFHKDHQKDVVVIDGCATVELPENKAGAVNLLHAITSPIEPGTKIGTIVAEYKDGTSCSIPVVAGRDIGCCWNPASCKNAALAWTHEYPDSLLGLYASTFPLPKPEAKSLRFEAVRHPWILKSVVLSHFPVRFPQYGLGPIEFKQNYEWKELSYKRILNKGCPLDFSFLADAPAGKYGFIKADPQGFLTFENAPGKRIRLFGVNLCFTASFLEKETVEKLADYFVYCGYNAVRLHHHDSLLLDKGAPNSVTLSESQLDKIDYLVFCMKQRGIYVTTDLYTSRQLKPGDNIPGCEKYGQDDMKMLLPVSPEALANWKEFAKQWMLHKNPYTGLTWAEEPALYCLNLVNEETIKCFWNRSPSGVKLYQEAFARFCAERNIESGQVGVENPRFMEFLHHIQGKVIDEQIRFVKKELGVKALITSLNFFTDVPLTMLRQQFDLVDNHTYFDHPSFPEKQWCLPYGYNQGCAIRQMANVPSHMMVARLPGKPFICTEFNLCNPNIHRAEGGPLIGGYSALQDWDAVYRFAWSHSSHSIETLGGAAGFDACNDPMAQLADRIAIAMFRRGDVLPAWDTYACEVPDNDLTRGMNRGFPLEFQKLGLITKIGAIPSSASVPNNTVKIPFEDITNPSALENSEIGQLWRMANEQKRAVSVTGQLRLDAEANTFVVSSSCTESVTVPCGGCVASALRIRGATCFQTIAAISLDGSPLTKSNSILIVQLTNVTNTGMQFNDGRQKLMTSWGQLPLLIKRGQATVELRCEHPLHVTALSCDGDPLGEVAATYEHGVLSFTADTGMFPGGVMAYHLQ